MFSLLPVAGWVLSGLTKHWKVTLAVVAAASVTLLVVWYTHAVRVQAQEEMRLKQLEQSLRNQQDRNAADANSQKKSPRELCRSLGGTNCGSLPNVR